MLKCSLWQIIQLSFPFPFALSRIFRNLRPTNKAWVQSQQMSEYFDGKIPLDRLLHLHVFHWNPFSLGVQKNLRLDHNCYVTTFISLHEVLRYQC